MCLIAGALWSPRAYATEQSPSACPASVTEGPIYWNLDRLRDAKQELEANPESSLHVALQKVLRDADAALTAKPYTVTDKERPPESGDVHDYVSMGPYWWPNPNTPDGLPYIRKDGERNPEVDGPNFDRRRSGNMTTDVVALSLAAYFTGDVTYAERAELFLRTWFIDPQTRMNPNLNHGQAIPGRTTGRGIGIIDSRIWWDVIDSVLLLKSIGMVSDDTVHGLRVWFAGYAGWLIESELGQDERKALNNHSTFYDAQLAHFVAFVGRCDLAAKIVEDALKIRVRTQIKPTGLMPLEQRRTRSLHYHAFNLIAFIRLAKLGRALDVDIYETRPRRAGSIKDSVDLLASYVGRVEEWPYETIDNRGGQSVWLMLKQALVIDDDPALRRALQQSASPVPTDNINLLTYE